ncbi:MAG: hypothetical protein HKN76_04425 [Saprospiraceae bacterium]|nr:hypothetical protein [Saprospiraceae bacterium]
MNLTDVKIEAIAVHQVGDKSLKEPLVMSHVLLEPPVEQVVHLKSFFLDHFRGQEFYNFALVDGSPSRISYITESIFNDPESLLSNSCEVARLLYGLTESDLLENGLLYMCHISNVINQDEIIDAIGMYFCPLDDSFITVNDLESQPLLTFSSGTYLGKQDMACLIYNTERELGYKVDVIDKSKKARDGQLWKEHFLRLKPAEDDFFLTSQVMGLTKSFVEHQLPSEFEIEKKDQMEYLDRSINYFKNQDHYSQQEFADEIFADSHIAQSFGQYKHQYEEDHDVQIQPEFDLNEYAVKKQARIFKSVLKLDRNFHIYIHGDRSMIVKDTDEQGRKFYKLYYEKES